MFISSTLWILISTIYLVGGDIAAAIRSMK